MTDSEFAMGLTLAATAKPETREDISRFGARFKQPVPKGPGQSPVALLARQRWLRLLRHPTPRSGGIKWRSRDRRETALVTGRTYPSKAPAACSQAREQPHPICLTIDYRAAAGPAQVGQQRREAQHCGQDTIGSRYERCGYTVTET